MLGLAPIFTYKNVLNCCLKQYCDESISVFSRYDVEFLTKVLAIAIISVIVFSVFSLCPHCPFSVDFFVSADFNAKNQVVSLWVTMLLPPHPVIGAFCITHTGRTTTSRVLRLAPIGGHLGTVAYDSSATVFTYYRAALKVVHRK